MLVERSSVERAWLRVQLGPVLTSCAAMMRRPGYSPVVAIVAAGSENRKGNMYPTLVYLMRDRSRQRCLRAAVSAEFRRGAR